MPSPVHLWIPVRARVFLTDHHVVHQGLSNLVAIKIELSENEYDLGCVNIKMSENVKETKAMASGLVEGSTSIEIGAGTPSMAAGTCLEYY